MRRVTQQIVQMAERLRALPADTLVIITGGPTYRPALAHKRYGGSSPDWMFIGTDDFCDDLEFADDLVERGSDIHVLFTPERGWTPPQPEDTVRA